MIHPSEAEIANLEHVAREIRDTTDERGYRVGVALNQDEAFSQTGHARSSLVRALVLEAARSGASQAGMQIEDAPGGGLDIVTTSNTTIRRYRVKGLRLTANGTYEVICGARSRLLMAEPNTLLQEENWILGFVVSDDYTIDRIIAAEIIGWTGTGPVRLNFGTIIDLSDHQPPRRFISTDEDLEGFEDDDAGTADAV